MTDQATRVVPAGWYEDPSNAQLVRWWNGIAWTEHTNPKPDLDAAADAEAEALEKSFAAAALDARPRGQVISTSTSASWVLAFSPLLYLAAVVAAFGVDLYLVQTPAVWALLVIPYAVTVLFAVLDARKLARWGHTPPKAFWGFFGPLIYLVVRKTKVSGWSQLGTHLGIVVAVVGLGAALWSTDAVKPVTLALRIQTEIRDDLVGGGTVAAVACPPVADTTTVGTLYTCDATLLDGGHRAVWVSIDSDSGDYSYTFALK